MKSRLNMTNWLMLQRTNEKKQKMFSLQLRNLSGKALKDLNPCLAKQQTLKLQLQFMKLTVMSTILNEI